MTRLARVVVPGHPHHVTQRGNGRARTFFGDADYALYRDLLAANCKAAGVEVWAWCLMSNHVHLILVPSDSDGLRRAQDWRWSSTRAHLRGKDDGLTALAPIRDRFLEFADLLATEPEADLLDALRSAESIGRPLGDNRFLARIERQTGRVLKPAKRGPKPSVGEAGI